MEQTVWNQSDLGISFAASSGRINIFKTTLKALGYPPYFRFLLDTDHKQLGIECCGYESDGSHTLPDDHTQEYYTVNSKDMVRFIYQTCGWDKRFTYRIKGIAIPDRRMVVFDLTTALKVAEFRKVE
ncbi:hypothetical protein [Ruminococcus flavefaciens]|uniref:hypothetical protein n=1 Tax=Ruminococcus flavefaciens TaxID=1265 RepID=UPI0026E95488|nr:hypothetical protein [Ruminococcus flavefaciens]MDD7517075.1 hypothetical protein [Ruminococcus flavefaciens]MDY5692069.1 hypothetical protein [Ruminococcus flavefaciens]